MKFLIDTSSKNLRQRAKKFPSLVAGQLCTPLTNYRNWGGQFAIDNGAYSGLNREAFFRLLERNRASINNCLFCAVPDIVGNARRTDELYYHITQEEQLKPYNRIWAYVMQDGHEDLELKWYAINWLFIGGTDRFKDSAAAWDIVKTAKALSVPVHVGRVNTWKRYEKYTELGSDTCDGSGIAKYDHMLEEIAAKINKTPEPMLWESEFVSLQST